MSMITHFKLGKRSGQSLTGQVWITSATCFPIFFFILLADSSNIFWKSSKLHSKSIGSVHQSISGLYLKS